jgi:MoxR-like ATPase
VLGAEEAVALQRVVRDVAASEPALRYAASLARATRPDDPSAPALVKRAVRWGAGPRAGQALVLGAKAHAFLAGRATVAPEDIRRVALPVLRHRVLASFAAEAEGVTPEQVIGEVLEKVAPPRSGISV